MPASKKKRPRRKIPGAGGTQMKVVQVLDRDRVIGMPIEDNDFRLNQYVIFTRPLRVTKKTPADAVKCTYWIKKIVPTGPPRTRVSKPPRPVKLITSREEPSTWRLLQIPASTS